ncbi:diguanylate cyclase [Maridesulfovibrio ferrireducens]|uniref:sensor domain-containing diguanylate cyclase n=1 Tax=Maridesulfovibrio ferrireducens TaxID=246191 RepID=UPI001A193F3A|nr:diguanylate cyclase [Maridesulfovibrio ferrireducens]MBI9111016.1 diguanylate cyclase [Maridesulfovibrio ferrireducens]
MNNELDLKSISSELVLMREKHETLKHKILKKCPECEQAQFKELFAHAACAIVVLDENGNIIFTNKSFNDITGFSQEESLKSPIHQIMLSSDLDTANFIKNISSNSEYSTNLIFPMVHKNHDEIWVDMSVKNITDDSNSCKSSICIFKDITKEKESELRKEELIEELMEVKELQEDNSAQLNLLLHELDDKNLKLKKEISERKKAENKLRESEERFKSLSITDQLTGLYNRRHLQDVAHAEFDRCKRDNKPLCALLMDVDDFKHFNDTYGHSAGDEVLERVGKLLRQSIRDSDRAFRYGGEEFIILLPETECKQAILTAEKIRVAMAEEQYTPNEGAPVHKTISIGVAEYEPGECLDKMLKRADDNMYQAKIKGKNRVYFSCETGSAPAS